MVPTFRSSRRTPALPRLRLGPEDLRAFAERGAVRRGAVREALPCR